MLGEGGEGGVKASIFSHNRFAYKNRKSTSTKIGSEIKQSCFHLPAGTFIEVVPRELRVMKNTAAPEWRPPRPGVCSVMWSTQFRGTLRLYLWAHAQSDLLPCWGQALPCEPPPSLFSGIESSSCQSKIFAGQQLLLERPSQGCDRNTRTSLLMTNRRRDVNAS